MQTASSGGGISLWARFRRNELTDLEEPVVLGTDVLLEQDASADKVAVSCAQHLRIIIDKGVCVDEHIQDQLIPYLAICGGVLTGPKLTSHTKTNLKVCENFLGTSFKIEETDQSSIIFANDKDI